MKKFHKTEILLIAGMIFSILVSHLPVLYTVFYHELTDKPKAEAGRLHFSKGNGGERIILDGEWEFYWKRLLISEKETSASPDMYLPVPHCGSRYRLEGDYLPAKGFASFRLILDGYTASHPVTVYIPDFGSAYRIYIDGSLASESGVVSKNQDHIYTTTEAKLYPISLSADKEHEIIIEVATTRFAGLYMAPRLQSYDEVVLQNSNRNNLRMILFGTVLFSFFILVVLYVCTYRKTGRSTWLPVIGLLVILRIMLTTEFYHFWQKKLFFNLSYEDINPLMFLVSFAFKYLLIFLVQELLGIICSRRQKLGFLIYYILLYFLYLFIPKGFYNRHLSMLLPVCAFAIELFLFFKVYINRDQMKKYGMLIYWGTVLAITGLIADCYYINGSIYLNLSLSLLVSLSFYLMILSIVSAMQLADVYRDYAVASASLSQAREQISMQTEYYDALREQMDEVRAICHDVRHFVGVIKRLSEENRYEELKQFIYDYVEKVDPAPLPVFCENIVANSILGYYSNLSGLVVTLHKNNGTTEEVDFTEFTAKGITVSPADGTILTTGHDKLIITHTATGKSVEQEIRVNPITVDTVTVKTPPTKTTYIEGETLDLSGLVVTLRMNNGTTEEVDLTEFTAKGITVSPADGTMLTTGHDKLIITHTATGKSVEQEIKVNPITVDTVTVKTPPTKTSYIEGETLDLSGLVVTLRMNNGTTEDVDFTEFTAKGITVSPAEGTILTTGHDKVTITHTASGKTVEQKLLVNTASVTVDSITVKTPPSKTTYTEGENLDLTGFVVTLHKSNNTTEDVDFTEFHMKGIVTIPENGTPLSVSHTSIVATYTVDNKSVDQPILVNPVVIDAVISPTSINYDLNSPTDISTTITWNSASTVTDVIYGTSSLSTPDAYVVTGGALTIRSSYIDTLGASVGDVLNFMISFDKGNPAFLAVNLVNSYVPASNALLSNLTVNGSPVSGFDPNTTEYYMELPYGTTSVLVGAIPEDPHATVVITQPEGIPGSATVTVTAEDKISTRSYTIYFTMGNAPVTYYSITLQSDGNGTASANVYSASKDTEITLTATPNSGYLFKEWQVVEGGVTIVNNKFTMPASNVIVKAIFEQIPVATYQVNINGSYAVNSGAGSYYEGDIVTINAGSYDNYSFSGWTSTDGITLANIYSQTTTFVMPAKDVTITATWSYNSGSGFNPGDSTDGGIVSIEVNPDNRPNQPIIGSAQVTAKKQASNTATTVIYKKAIANAVSKARAEAKKQDKTDSGIGISLSVSIPAGSNSLSINLSQAILTELIKEKVLLFEIDTKWCKLKFNLEALEEILKQSTGDVTINITPVTDLNGDAKTMIGSRPIYDITISYVKDGKTHYITSLGEGRVTISIPYTPNKKENGGFFFGVYVDDEGNGTRIEASTYEINSQSVLIGSRHLSVYGVGYEAPKKKYEDISAHWAKESIDYVVSRGLISDTTTTTFSTNRVIDRGTLVTALGRLAGVDVSKYKTITFTDVKADQDYGPYAEWAYKKGIISNVGNGMFAPEQAVTREVLALILINYAKATDVTLPVTREAIDFADASMIGSKYEEAVKALQQAGIMMGGSDNKFNPKAYEPVERLR